MINDAVTNVIAPLIARLEALETNRSEATAPANFTQALTSESEGSSVPDVAESSVDDEPLPIIEAIENIESPTIKKNLNAAPAKPKSKPEAKYTLTNLTALTTVELRKIYNQVLPIVMRDGKINPKANFASKDVMIKAILKA